MPAPEPPSPERLTDDQVRWLMLRVASSLARLWARLRRYEQVIGAQRQDYREPIRIQEIPKEEPWLAGVDQGRAIKGVCHDVNFVQLVLLEAGMSTRPPSRKAICMLVQHIAHDTAQWSPNTVRLAAQLGVELQKEVKLQYHPHNVATMIYQLDGTYEDARLEREARARREAAKGKP